MVIAYTESFARVGLLVLGELVERKEDGMECTPRARLPKGLLRRKFSPPPFPSPCSGEASLTPAVMELSSWRVCLLSTAPGYGKTTLLSQWHRDFAARDDCMPLWMTIDERDGCAYRFVAGLAYLLSAVDERFDCFCDFSALEGRSLEELLTDVVNMADEVADPSVRYIVFLDEYDNAASSELDTALVFLNRYCAVNFRFIAAGSYFSPKIDDLLLDSSVAEYGTHDLLFSEQRIRDYAFSLMPELTDGQYALMRDEFGVWPTSYLFASLARKRSSGKDMARVMDGYHRRFFAKEVMSRIDAKTYEFLVETSGLTCLIPELCDKVTGSANSRSIIDYLETHNLFIHFDADLGGYVLQPMFKRFLMDKLLCLRSTQIIGLASRAAEWYAERGMHNELAKCVAIMADPHYIRGTIESSMGIVWQRGEAQNSFLEFLVKNPAENYRKDKYLVWVVVWAYISMGLPAEARQWINLAETTCSAHEDVAVRRTLGYANAICLALEGDSESSIQVIRDILSRSEDALPQAFQCLLIHMEGENCERLGNPKEGRNLYLKALSLAERAKGAFFKLFDMYCLAHQYAYLGCFEDALSLVNRALSSCEEKTALYGEFHAIRAFCQIERGEFEGAAQSVAVARENVTLNSNLDMYVDAHLAHARFEHARGNAIEAYEIVSDVVAAVAGKKVPRNLHIEAYALLAEYSVELEEVSVARSCEQVLDAFSEGTDCIRVMPSLVGKARILWAKGDRSGGFEALERCKSIAQECGSTLFLAKACLLEAVYRFEEGDETRAMVNVGKAIELSMKGGYLDLFLAGGKPARELVIRFVTGRKASCTLRSYAKKVLLAFGSEGDVASDLALREGDVQGYWALTEREREILHSLNSGMSRREIAESYGVSQNTVKSHLKNIYAKLGVHTRSEAYKASLEPDSQG